MPKRLPYDPNELARRAAAFRALERNPIFTAKQFAAMAQAARVENTLQFAKVVRSAAIHYLGWRMHRARWKSSLAKAQLADISKAAARLEKLLTKLPRDARRAVEHGARQVESADLRSGRLERTTDATPALRVRVDSAGVSNYAMDVTDVFANPTAAYPVEVLRRAAGIAASLSWVNTRFDPVAITAEFLSQHVPLPLTATVAAGSNRSGATPGGRADGRLVRLLVIFSRCLSNLKLPAFRLPADDVELSAEGAKDAIKRAKVMSVRKN